MPASLRFMCVLLLSLPTFGLAQEDCARDRFLCVDRLNEGLGDVPRDVDRGTPRATVESLFFLADAERWTDAAHLLDLSGVDDDAQAARGSDLARRLVSVLQRKALIDWDLLVDRPDGLNARAPSDDAMSGEPRRSILVVTIAREAAPASIRLSRVNPSDGAPAWVFSSQSVQTIPSLYALYGPGQLERMLPDWLRRNSVFDLKRWELIGLPLLLVLGWIAGRVVLGLIGWIARRTERKLASHVVNAVRGPAALAAATGVFLVVGSQLFVFSGLISTILTPLGWLGLLGAAIWLVINGMEAALDGIADVGDTDLTEREAEQARDVATRVAAIKRALVVILVLLGGGLFLSQTNLFQNLGFTLIGTAGALTLVIGFAARSVLSNIMSSLQIALNGSARIGDRVVYNGYLCHVERINFTFVQLRDWEGVRLVVPVEEFVSETFENWTMKEPEMLRIIKLKFAHDADVSALREIFDSVVNDIDDAFVSNPDEAQVRVAGQDVFGKDVWFALPCADPNTSWDAACQAREAILARASKLAKDTGAPVFPDAHAAEAA